MNKSLPKYGPYTPIVKAGEYYYISGQVGVDQISKVAPSDVVDQLRIIFDNLKKLLATEHLTLDNIIKTTIFLTDITDFARINEVYVAMFNEPRPARSTVGVKQLPMVGGGVDLKIEIEAIAYKKGG
ncbi:MAG: RidA family protein [Patescibacteria group bacterium]|jgi:2-iminobutanoate/2-iminopropanoate deaminase|nr:RidA family protein [Patescibacteria group bacterium]